MAEQMLIEWIQTDSDADPIQLKLIGGVIELTKKAIGEASKADMPTLGSKQDVKERAKQYVQGWAKCQEAYDNSNEQMHQHHRSWAYNTEQVFPKD